MFAEDKIFDAIDPRVRESVERLRRRKTYLMAKRLFDVAFSLFVLIAFSWLYFLVAVAIKIDDPRGPIFFKQLRIGERGRTFVMYKFRSMYVDAEEQLESLLGSNEKSGPAFKMRNDPRVTRVGRIIRKTSIDELPQFINVVKGDLSVVGPRPAIPSEVARYDVHQRQRLLVKPGITCYWQVCPDRDAVSFDEWVELDLKYIETCGLRTDLMLIVKTAGAVLTAQGN